MGDFVRAVGGWWVGAVLLVVGIAWIVVLEPGSLPAGVVVTVVGMIIVLVGAYRAYRRVALERNDPQSRPEPDAVRFTIKTGRPYAGIPSGLNSLIIPTSVSSTGRTPPSS